jgi:hypothetical protein
MSAGRAFTRSVTSKTAVMACYRQLPIALLENGLQQEGLASRAVLGFDHFLPAIMNRQRGQANRSRPLSSKAK